MAVELHSDIEGGLLPRLWSPRLEFTPAPAAQELFRWAQFLAQGDTCSVSRERSVEALLEAADGNRDAISAARLHALRALRDGVGTRGALDLLQAALDHPNA